MTNETLIKIGSVFHLSCSLSHLFFPIAFKWEENLIGLSLDKKAKIRQHLSVSNLSAMMFWLILSYIPFFYSYELTMTNIGKSLLTSIVIFWVVRIFILQPVIFGLKTKESLLRTVFFLTGFVFFLIPWIRVIF